MTDYRFADADNMPEAYQMRMAALLGAQAVTPSYAQDLVVASNPLAYVQGAPTLDTFGRVVSWTVGFMDGTPGQFVVDTYNARWNAPDAWHVTKFSSPPAIYTQSAVTRDSSGRPSNVPAMTRLSYDYTADALLAARFLGSDLGSDTSQISSWAAHTGTVLGTGLALAAAGDTVTKTAHGLINGQSVQLSSIVTATGVSAGVNYFVVGATTNAFQLSLTFGGSAVDITADGTATVTLNAPLHLDALAQATSAAKPTVKAVGPNGKKSALFDGTAQFLTTAAWGTPLAQPGSFLCVFKFANTGATQYVADAISNAAGAWRLYIDSANKPRIAVGSGASLGTGVALDTSKYHVAVAVFDGASSAFYVDSITAGATGTLNTDSLGAVRLGRQGAGGGFLNGEIAEYAAIGRALTADQVKSVMASMVVSYGSAVTIT